jgi:hypothetical protein
VQEHHALHSTCRLVSHHAADARPTKYLARLIYSYKQHEKYAKDGGFYVLPGKLEGQQLSLCLAELCLEKNCELYDP